MQLAPCQPEYPNASAARGTLETHTVDVMIWMNAQQMFVESMLSASIHLEVTTVDANLILSEIRLKPAQPNQKKNLMISATQFNVAPMPYATLANVCAPLALKETIPMTQPSAALPFQNAHMILIVATMKFAPLHKMESPDDVLMLAAGHLVDPMPSA
jgi:hypothetical protein